MISWFELKHLVADLRARRRPYPFYAYTTGNSPLHRVELLWRRRYCRRHSNRFAEGAHGELADTTWKRGCLICFAERP